MAKESWFLILTAIVLSVLLDMELIQSCDALAIWD